MKTWIKALLPFLFFLIGFSLTAMLIRRETFTVPSVVGLSLSEAVLIFSNPTAQLIPRILAEREDETIVPGTVLAQVPRPGQHVKSQQCVYLTVSKGPQKALIPDFMGLSAVEADDLALQKRLRVKKFVLPDMSPTNTVIAQTPPSGTIITDDPVILYVSRGFESSLKIIPDLSGLLFDDVARLAAQNGFKVVPLSESFLPREAMVTGQRPLAGSIVDAVNPVTIQVQCG